MRHSVQLNTLTDWRRNVIFIYFFYFTSFSLYRHKWKVKRHGWSSAGSESSTCVTELWYLKSIELQPQKETRNSMKTHSGEPLGGFLPVLVSLLTLDTGSVSAVSVRLRAGMLMDPHHIASLSSPLSLPDSVLHFRERSSSCRFLYLTVVTCSFCPEKRKAGFLWEPDTSLNSVTVSWQCAVPPSCHAIYFSLYKFLKIQPIFPDFNIRVQLSGLNEKEPLGTEDTLQCTTKAYSSDCLLGDKKKKKKNCMKFHLHQ